MCLLEFFFTKVVHHSKTTLNPNICRFIQEIIKSSCRKSLISSTTCFIPTFKSPWKTHYWSSMLGILTNKHVPTTLFRNKRFMLDEMTQWNASKFAIFLEYEKPHSFFPFLFCATLFFSLMNALVYVNIDQGIH